MWPRRRKSVGSCEHGNEPWGPTKCGDLVTTEELLKKDFAPWSWLVKRYLCLGVWL
jgi:hypothetical protein